MTSVILFVLLAFLFGWLIRLLIRNNPNTLTGTELGVAFGVKIIFGCAYGYIFFRYFGGDDTWYWNQQSLKEQYLLIHSPDLYFRDFSPLLPFQRNNHFMAGFMNLLADWENYLITKPLAIFNFISGGNYYLNVVLFSFMSFWGHYWLWSLLTQLYPSKRKLLFLFIFFFPPVLFWLSGIRGDAWLFFFTALTLLHFHRWIQTGRKRSLIYLLIGVVGIMIFRDIIVLLLLPGLLAWWISVKKRQRVAHTFILIYGIVAVLFLGSMLLPDQYNVGRPVAARQASFMKLKGNTVFKLDTLQPTPGSFVRTGPQAFLNVFFRPFPWEIKGPLQLMAAADTIFFTFLLIIFLWQYRKVLLTSQKKNADKSGIDLINVDPHPKAALMMTLLFFGVILYLFIGYTVPFPGAIVRYKIIPELLLYVWLIVHIRIDHTYNKILHI